MSTDEKLPELEDEICDAVREWVRRASRRVCRDMVFSAEMKIFLHQPSWEDDGTSVLDARIIETAERDTVTGRVTTMGKRGAP